MAVVSVKEAARRLGVSEQRTRAMVREQELIGHQVGHTWLIDATSVQDRARISIGRGRPWSERTIAAIVTALSTGERVDSKAALRLRHTSVNQLWRKIAQGVTVSRFRARNLDIVRRHLTLTGESAIEEIGERLVGQAGAIHGYLRGITLEDLIDDAGLVEDSDGNVVIYQARSGETALVGRARADRAQRALIAVDCARSASTRVRSAGLRALEDMRDRWLAKNT